MHSSTHDAIAAAWRIESAKVVATVARMVRDVAVAEELAQEALVAALERWPRARFLAAVAELTAADDSPATTARSWTERFGTLRAPELAPAGHN